MHRSQRLVRVAVTAALLGCSTPAQDTAQPARASVATPAPLQQGTLKFGDAPQHAYTAEFFPGTTYDAAIATPDALLGVALGSRPAHHAEVLALWRTWASQSKRVKLETYGYTHEGRELVCGVVSSEENIRNLEALLARVAKLADPRQLAAGEQDGIARDTPAVAWLGYSIHGDEMSGVDGGLALAHHLIAGTSSDVSNVLKDVVVVFDPMQNPDGRERFLSMLEQNAGATPVLDGDALSHGRWPNGRGNHYLFDMNRDWIAGVAPETRGRWKVVQRFHPQLFVDAHEMGRDDSYLFYPQADPINPHLPAKLVEWQTRYAADIAKAFDAHGWSYYTREWADGWGPFYSDSWGSLNGAIGILYEQARFDGQSVKLDSGEVATYREAAHRQATASLANVKTLAANREAVLRDYAEHRRASVDDEPAGGQRRFVVIRHGSNHRRDALLIAILVGQGIEVLSTGGLALSNAVAASGEISAALEIEGDAWVIDTRQPQGALARAFLELDTRYPKSDLERERKELESKNSSRIYDSTAWNLLHACDADAWWCESYTTSRKLEGPLTAAPQSLGQVTAAADPGARVYGWLVDGANDASVVFAARALELGLVVNACDESFESAGRPFPRGSLLVRAHENGADAAELVGRAAQHAGVQAFATTSARAPGVGHDLGGQHFALLERPRVALLSNSPVSSDQFGHLWHTLDRELGLPVSLLDAQDLGGYDLRRYNVLVLPPAGGLGSVLEDVREDLAAWVRSGGTLIAVGGSAAALCNEKLELTGVRRRADVLEKLEEWRHAAKREQGGQQVAIDESTLWDGPPPATETGGEKKADDKADEKADGKTPAKKDADPDAKREESWMQRFAPQGVFLRGLVRSDHWLTAGAREEMPVYFDGSLSLWSRSPVTAAVRLAPSERLRMSGLLWPEARERLADSAYLTVERLGHGQVILFASQPNFRGYHAATGRFFANAVVLGPGLGANPARQR